VGGQKKWRDKYEKLAPSEQFASAKQVPTFAAPQTPFSLHALVERQVLQLVLHLRAQLHQLLPVPQQLPHIPHRGTRHPQPRKPPVEQQLQNMLRVVLIEYALQSGSLEEVWSDQLIKWCCIDRLSRHRLSETGRDVRRLIYCAFRSPQ
jgi:hypothetical protein